MPKAVDLTDLNPFGRLTAVHSTDRRTRDGKVVWFCKCVCGQTAFVAAKALTSGNTQSCGCSRGEKTRGDRNPSWKGGANNIGSPAWATKRLNAARLKAKKFEYAPISLSSQELVVAVAAHDGRCDICGTPADECRNGLVLDHNHDTGEFRGFLCPQCNHGIGLLKDSSSVLLKAAAYLGAEVAA